MCADRFKVQSSVAAEAANRRPQPHCRPGPESFFGTAAVSRALGQNWTPRKSSKPISSSQLQHSFIITARTTNSSINDQERRMNTVLVFTLSPPATAGRTACVVVSRAATCAASKSSLSLSPALLEAKEESRSGWREGIPRSERGSTWFSGTRPRCRCHAAAAIVGGRCCRQAMDVLWLWRSNPTLVWKRREGVEMCVCVCGASRLLADVMV